MKTKITSVLLFFAMVIIVASGCNRQEEKREIANSIITDNISVNQKQRKDPDKKILVGEWSRTDAPCTVKITGALKNGKLEVGYFIPKSINVGKANWTKVGTLLSIYVELQDENFMGSNYKLNYIPERDVLVGEYFEAVGGGAFSVEFVRTK